jgi:hypothetical protein
MVGGGYYLDSVPNAIVTRLGSMAAKFVVDIDGVDLDHSPTRLSVVHGGAFSKLY